MASIDQTVTAAQVLTVTKNFMNMYGNIKSVFMGPTSDQFIKQTIRVAVTCTLGPLNRVDKIRSCSDIHCRKPRLTNHVTRLIEINRSVAVATLHLLEELEITIENRGTISTNHEIIIGFNNFTFW